MWASGNPSSTANRAQTPAVLSRINDTFPSSRYMVLSRYMVIYIYIVVFSEFKAIRVRMQAKKTRNDVILTIFIEDRI